MRDRSNPGVAIIGCGMWGINHVRTWTEIGALRAVFDLDPGRLQDVRDRYPKVDVRTELSAVLDDPDIAAVVVATPAAIHERIATDAMKAGKDVLVEKPMALSVTEGRRLVETADALGRILAVGHVLQYHPAVAKIGELVEEGVLGRVRYLSANRLNLGRIRTEENALWSFAPHDIAIMLQILDVMPEEIGCTGGTYLSKDVADVTLTDLRFPDGVIGHIFVSWLHPYKEHRFVVVGDRQMAVFDDMQPWDEKLVLYPHSIDWLAGRTPVARKAEGVPVPLTPREPLLVECEAFLRAITTGEKPLSDGQSGLDVLRVLEAAQSSLESRNAGVPLGAEQESYWAHPTAVVDAGADVGAGTRVWHFSHVMPGAHIGPDCVLGQNVFVGNEVRIGRGVKIQNNVSVYEGVELEDYVFCGPSMVFTNVVDPRSEVERKDEFRATLVKRGATLGANCTILCGVTIGSYALVGAGAVVTRDVGDHELVAGVPATRIGHVCRCGRRLDFDGDAARCSDCGRAYIRAGDTVSEDDERSAR